MLAHRDAADFAQAATTDARSTSLRRLRRRRPGIAPFLDLLTIP
jgi:hypothetical protein